MIATQAGSLHYKVGQGFLLVRIAAVISVCVVRFAMAQDADWPAYLGGLDSGQYSSLEQINKGNVKNLALAWEYRVGDAEDLGQIQCNPLIVDGVLYGTSPKLKAFAVDAATGAEKWVLNPFGSGGSSGGVNRGLMHWREGADSRIFYAAGFHLIALNAASGEPITSFGEDGRVDLRAGLSRDSSKLYVLANTPGVIYQDLLILGTRVNEAHPAAPGDIRAYDVRTGAIAWNFRTIPQPGDFGYETWPPDAWKSAGGANSWAGMSLDPARGIVYVPTGSAAYDFYGADRHGQNLFANCVLALDARTGARRWHFQIVRHDLWDRDLPAPPNLMTIERDGRRIDAVAQITKSAHIFIFDRETGEPLFPIEERAFAASTLKGEAAWPTQPIPTKPPAFARQTFAEAEVTDISPESHAFVLDRVKRYRTGEQFIPPSEEGTIVFPGFDGGGEWGGAAVDPGTGILYVNSSEMAWVLQMVDASEGGGASGRSSRAGRMVYARNCLFCHGVNLQGDPLKVYPALTGLSSRLTREQASTIIKNGQGLMPGFPHLEQREIDTVLSYLFETPDASTPERVAGEGASNVGQYSHTGYIRFVDQDGYPAVKPPWGTLNAIDLNKGEILWKVTLGDTPALRAKGLPQTGTENYGGPVVTAGGLIFIGATNDEMFHAFDKDTGKLLWETRLPAGGYATPATYAVNGKQFVVIAAGGGKMGTKDGGSYLSFALSAVE